MVTGSQVHVIETFSVVVTSDRRFTVHLYLFFFISNAGIIVRNSTTLCYMFRNWPDLKVDVQNLGTHPSPICRHKKLSTFRYDIAT